MTATAAGNHFLDVLAYDARTWVRRMTATMQNKDSLNHSTVYQEFLAEKEEIDKHKWIESQKAGHDIGFDRALTDWIVHHRAGWRRWRKTLRAGQ